MALSNRSESSNLNQFTRGPELAYNNSQPVSAPRPAIVCFIHLRWHSVFQRPHHLLSRMAKHQRVILFEEPICTDTDTDTPYLTSEDVAPNIRVYTPHLRTMWPFFSGDRVPEYTALLRELMRREKLTDYMFWYYTPMALHFTREFAPRAIVYDIMDELSRFKNAPDELLGLEAELLKRSDVVFTGGPSLYNAKKNRHRNVHCFSSSVDSAHFEKALAPECEVHPKTAELPRPRLGFYGVIDERVDLPLLDKAAEMRPDWQFVMVGPVVKIEEKDLPHRPNLHFLGQANYAELPAHLAGWDVALMPFARNGATEFISPTKTIEYMAAMKPIVSTSIRDVVQPYGHVVAIADQPEAFVAACDEALNETAARRHTRETEYASILKKTSWDQTAERMRQLIKPLLEYTESTSTEPMQTLRGGRSGAFAELHRSPDAES